MTSYNYIIGAVGSNVIAPTTVTPTSEPAVCEGYKTGIRCIIPFDYNNVRYMGCTNVDANGFYWCSTGSTEEDWDYCVNDCRFVGPNGMDVVKPGVI